MPKNSASDHELLQRWRAGDQMAGSDLIKRHFDTLYCFFGSKVESEVADLVQRTALACVRARDRVPPQVSFKAYLLGIARNQLLMHWRTQGRRRKIMDDRCVSGQAIEPSASWFVARREQQRTLLRALQTLPLSKQIAIELYYWERMSLEDIASVLSISVTAVKSRLFRARASLREYLQETGEPAFSSGQTSASALAQWADAQRRRALSESA